MSTFIQLHLLTSYPPANLNRDDLGRPKTAMMGGAQRLRISSQSLKRAWRTSTLFQEALSSHMGIRTKEMGVKVEERLINGGISEKKAKKWAADIAAVFGKLKKDSVEIEQLAHFSPEEKQAIDNLIETLVREQRPPKNDELDLLRMDHTAADIALFGRMLADNPVFNTEAAAQVAHAISVHKVALEDDYFTAVDDLNDGKEDVGAAHIGEGEFAAGLFYIYCCINRDLLIENLSGDEDLADKTVRAFAEAALTVAPTGKQNSYASRAYASYVLAEKGERQPRSLSVSFLRPINGLDMLGDSISAIEDTRKQMDKVYGPVARDSYSLNAVAGKGNLEKLLAFAASPIQEKAG